MDDKEKQSKKQKQKASKPAKSRKASIDEPINAEEQQHYRYHYQQQQQQRGNHDRNTVSRFLNRQHKAMQLHESYQNEQMITSIVPSDHPSSSVIQSLRICTLCHRALSRNQFSERCRFVVNLSLGPGAVCRTCTMTVCATKLKMMPSHEQLLLEFSDRGTRSTSPRNVSPGSRRLLGYSNSLTSNVSDLTGIDGVGALIPVIHGESPNSKSSILQRELVPFLNHRMQSMPISTNGQRKFDITSIFSEEFNQEERPAHIADCKYIDAVFSMPCYPKLNAMGLFKSTKDLSVSMAALEAVRLYGTLASEDFVPKRDNTGHDFREKVGNRDEFQETHHRNATNRHYNSKTDLKSCNPKSIVCLVLGEGCSPHTAVLASQHYGWTAISIDPSLSDEWDGYHDSISDYVGYSGTISDFMSDDEYAESFVELSKVVRHLIIIGIQMSSENHPIRLKGRSDINEIRARYEDVPTTLVSLSPLRLATLAPTRREGQIGSKLEKDLSYEPNCSYVDEGIFAACRMVEVWNFHNSMEDEGTRSESDYGEIVDVKREESIERPNGINEYAQNNQIGFYLEEQHPDYSVDIHRFFQERRMRHKNEHNDISRNTKEITPRCIEESSSHHNRKSRKEERKKSKEKSRDRKSNMMENRESKTSVSNLTLTEHEIFREKDKNVLTLCLQEDAENQNQYRELDVYNENPVCTNFSVPVTEQNVQNVWEMALAKHEEKESFTEKLEKLHDELFHKEETSKIESLEEDSFMKNDIGKDDHLEHSSDSDSSFWGETPHSHCSDVNDEDANIRSSSDYDDKAKNQNKNNCTNSGILHDSCSNEEIDAFQSEWSDDEILFENSSSKLKPWHSKEKHGNSFMSYESYD